MLPWEVALPLFTPARWQLLPPALAAAETARIADIAAHWIENHERPRPGFAVKEVEWQLPLSIAGLTLTLKLDRVDTLDEGGLRNHRLQDRRGRRAGCVVHAAAARATARALRTGGKGAGATVSGARGSVRQAEGG